MYLLETYSFSSSIPLKQPRGDLFHEKDTNYSFNYSLLVINTYPVCVGVFQHTYPLSKTASTRCERIENAPP